MPLTSREIFDQLRAALGETTIAELHDDPKKEKDPWVRCDPAAIVAICTHLRDTDALAFDALECITGTDYPTAHQIHVTFHVYSYARKHRIVLKCFLPREAPVMPSVTRVWPVANWQERECFDLLGVTFEGHPDLRRILLPDDWVGHPLRKDFAEKSSYQGIPTTRPNPLELLKLGTRPKDGAKA